MATGPELKVIAEARLRSGKILLEGGDWDGAAYMFAHVLECALKAAACKTLGLSKYPDERGKHQHFMVHSFDQLLMFSGLWPVFTSDGVLEEQASWSTFTKEFLGDWTSLRYNKDYQNKFDEPKVHALLAALQDEPSGILVVMTRRDSW